MSGVLMQAMYMVDRKGLITTTRGDELPEHKKAAARSDGTPDMKDLRDVIAYVKPQTLIGLTGSGPAFTKVRGICVLCQGDCNHCASIAIYYRKQADSSPYSVRA